MPAAIDPFMDQRPAEPSFFLRIAVMEVESWIMADREGIASFLSVPVDRVPLDPDTLTYPKESLVSLARSSKRTRVRVDLVPRSGATSRVGPGYNVRIGEFVRLHWDVERASQVSDSLKRTLARLRAPWVF